MNIGVRFALVHLVLMTVLPLSATSVSFADDEERIKSAAMHGDTEEIDRLIFQDPSLVNRVSARPPNRKPTFSDGDTPLTVAADHGHALAVDLLIRRGAEIDSDGLSGRTPLFAAAEGGKIDVVKVLLTYKANVNKGCPSHAFVIAWGTQNPTKDLPESEANKGGIVTPIQVALIKGHRETADVLLAGGATEDLFVAAGMGHITEAKKFLEEDAKRASQPDGAGYTPLHYAARFGYVGMIDLLVSHGASVNACAPLWGTPLHLAADAKKVNAVRALLKYKADPNARAAHGRTPLHNAVYAGSVEIARLLIDAGADLKAHYDGDTPLHLAARDGQQQLVEFLIQRGADVNAPAGKRTFILCCQKARSTAITLYSDDEPVTMPSSLDGSGQTAKTGSTPTAPIQPEPSLYPPRFAVLPEPKETPLSYSVTSGRLEIAELLLKHGADPNIATDEDGYPLLAVILQKQWEATKSKTDTAKWKAMAELLRHHGATEPVRE